MVEMECGDEFLREKVWVGLPSQCPESHLVRLPAPKMVISLKSQCFQRYEKQEANLPWA